MEDLGKKCSMVSNSEVLLLVACPGKPLSIWGDVPLHPQGCLGQTGRDKLLQGENTPDIPQLLVLSHVLTASTDEPENPRSLTIWHFCFRHSLVSSLSVCGSFWMRLQELQTRVWPHPGAPAEQNILASFWVK